MSEITEKASEIATLAQNIVEGKSKLEMSWMTIGIISAVGSVYIALASFGVNLLVKCDTREEWIYQTILISLAVGITIPLTLIVSKMFDNDIGIFMIVYGIAGLVTSLAIMNSPEPCTTGTQHVPSVGIGASIVALLVGGFLMRPRDK